MGNRERNEPPIYIGSMAYQLGEIACDIRKDVQCATGEEQRWLELLIENGMVHYFKSRHCSLDNAGDVVESVLSQFQCSPDEVDAIIFTSYSYRSAYLHADLKKDKLNFSRYINSCLQRKVKLKNATFFGTFLAESGNFVSLLRAARNLIRAEGKKNVLCVNVDQIPHHPTQRRGALSGVMTNSDVAMAFMVSSEKGDFNLESLHQVFNPYLNTLGRGDGLKKQMEIMRGITDSAASTLNQADCRPDDYQYLIINNYSLNLMQQFASYMGFSSNKLMVENLPKFAHAFTADNIINLTTIAPKLTSGDRVFMLSGGTTNWGSCSVQKI